MAYSELHPGMLLTILEYTGEFPITKNHVAYNVKSIKVEKPYFGDCTKESIK